MKKPNSEQRLRALGTVSDAKVPPSKAGPTATSAGSSESAQKTKAALAWDHLPRLRQHFARVTLDDGCYVVEFDGGPSTQGYDKDEALYMAEDALATLADRHPANYNAKFIGDDAIVVWELLLQKDGH